jgi:molecular chaperone HtpG
MAKKRKFKAEIRQLLDILVNSLYTNREIFLRELISNSSDALDKLRFEQIRGTELIAPDVPLEIRIRTDKDGGRLVIEDTGVGMTEQEVIDNIGTIARSGTAAFLGQVAEERGSAATEAPAEEAAEAPATEAPAEERAAPAEEHAAAAVQSDVVDNIIGKFGVGFYSVFMVAREVVLTTRSAKPGAMPVRWRSDGLGSYEIEEIEGEADLARGTRIEVILKEDAKEFAEKFRVEQAVKAHSGFISFPILLDGERLNTTPALWREPKFKVTPERYAEFYKFLTYDDEPPFETLHVSVDAPVQFNALLFIPTEGVDLPSLRKEARGLDLYSRRVLIQRGAKELLPDYLGFLRGVVDSEDLPLNISRETLQENRVLNKIGQTLVDKILSRLEALAEKEPARFLTFWRTHAPVFRLGYADFRSRERYAKLLRFQSSHTDDGDQLVSLADYKARALEGQKTIYFVMGQSRAAAEQNPHTEIFRRKGIEVLYLLDPLEEFALEALNTFDGFNLTSVENVTPADLDNFTDTAADQDARAAEALSEEDAGHYDALLGRIKEILGERVTEVRTSARLSASPACLVSADGAMSSSMQKIFRIINRETAPPQKVFEVNRDHLLVRGLVAIFKRDPADRHLQDVVEQLFESSLLLEGYLEDPHAMVARIQSLMERATALAAQDNAAPSA